MVAGGVFQFVVAFGLRDQLLLDEPEGRTEGGRERQNQVVVRFAADADLQSAHAVLNRLDEADAAFGLDALGDFVAVDIAFTPIK